MSARQRLPPALSPARTIREDGMALCEDPGGGYSNDR